jgi:chemotaxis protein MotB
MSRLLHTIAPLLNELPNQVSISGHTDNLPYLGTNPDYSNWELSTDRANASRRELIAGGLDGRKLVRVVGMSDQVPMLDTSPDDPVNRRIELMMLDEFAAAQIRMQRPAEVVPGEPADSQSDAGYQNTAKGPEPLV